MLLAGAGTALATGLGAIPVFMLGERAGRARPFLWGLAAGLMATLSLVGLILPALDEGTTTEVVAGIAAGVAFLAVTQRILVRREPTIGDLSGAGVRRSLLVFLVLFVHSVPEGLAIGTAYASTTEGLGLFVIVGIALHNVPEGTSMAIPMQEAGFSSSQQFWTAVGTSAPQPVAAVASYLLVELVDGLLAISFGFAAGAMLALVAVELAPPLVARGNRQAGLAGALLGGAFMVAFAAVLGV